MTPLDRPRTYGECVALGLGTAARVCPHVDCRQHTGSALESCVLRLAERGGMSTSEVAEILGVDRTRVGQLERAAIRRVGVRLRALGVAA